MMSKPQARPGCPNFSSGPCAKRPGWTVEALAGTPVGRSHRAKIGKQRLGEVISRSAKILQMPDDWRLGIVPASDTGAIEMALWSLLGPRGVQMLAWESFGSTWVADVLKQLKLPDVKADVADYGTLPDLSKVDFSRDVVFTWNGTTSGVRVPNGDWIPEDHEGLVICDATSAVFAMDMPWDRLDVVTWSWQKVLGGEGAHGMIALSPRAVQRLESYTPRWPMPKIFRLTSGGKLNEGIFEGSTINTPSMVAAEDQLDALRWAESVGGLAGLKARSQANLAVLEDWVEKTPWIEFLAADKSIRSSTSMCLILTADWFVALSDEQKSKAVKAMAAKLDGEGVAYDIASYRDAPPGLRIWGGATVEADDIKALLPWIEWAYEASKAEFGTAAA